MKWLASRAFVTAVLLVIAIGMLVQLHGMGKVSRLVPLLVLVPTIALLGVQLTMDLVHPLRIRDRGWMPRGSGRATDPAETQRCQADRNADKVCDRSPARLLWVLALPVMVFLLGFTVAIPLHAFVQLRALSQERWRASLVMPAALLVLFLLFTRLLPDIRLWQGWIWMQLRWL
ncbi:MAG: hypothetical protein KBD56_08980 [Candidatus Eisenbacteria bacterium]|nr:hypothetical protein [Candidatus Eisenbacteria bacterium]